MTNATDDACSFIPLDTSDTYSHCKRENNQGINDIRTNSTSYSSKEQQFATRKVEVGDYDDSSINGFDHDCSIPTMTSTFNSSSLRFSSHHNNTRDTSTRNDDNNDIEGSCSTITTAFDNNMNDRTSIHKEQQTKGEETSESSRHVPVRIIEHKPQAQERSTKMNNNNNDNQNHTDDMTLSPPSDEKRTIDQGFFVDNQQREVEYKESDQDETVPEDGKEKIKVRKHPNVKKGGSPKPREADAITSNTMKLLEAVKTLKATKRQKRRITAAITDADASIPVETMNKEMSSPKTENIDSTFANNDGMSDKALQRLSENIEQEEDEEEFDDTDDNIEVRLMNRILRSNKAPKKKIEEVIPTNIPMHIDNESEFCIVRYPPTNQSDLQQQPNQDDYSINNDRSSTKGDNNNTNNHIIGENIQTNHPQKPRDSVQEAFASLRQRANRLAESKKSTDSLLNANTNASANVPYWKPSSNDIQDNKVDHRESIEAKESIDGETPSNCFLEDNNTNDDIESNGDSTTARNVHECIASIKETLQAQEFQSPVKLQDTKFRSCNLRIDTTTIQSETEEPPLEEIESFHEVESNPAQHHSKEIVFKNNEVHKMTGHDNESCSDEINGAFPPTMRLLKERKKSKSGCEDMVDGRVEYNEKVLASPGRKQSFGEIVFKTNKKTLKPDTKLMNDDPIQTEPQGMKEILFVPRDDEFDVSFEEGEEEDLIAEQYDKFDTEQGNIIAPADDVAIELQSPGLEDSNDANMYQIRQLIPATNIDHQQNSPYMAMASPLGNSLSGSSTNSSSHHRRTRKKKSFDLLSFQSEHSVSSGTATHTTGAVATIQKEEQESKEIRFIPYIEESIADVSCAKMRLKKGLSVRNLQINDPKSPKHKFPDRRYAIDEDTTFSEEPGKPSSPSKAKSFLFRSSTQQQQQQQLTQNLPRLYRGPCVEKQISEARINHHSNGFRIPFSSPRRLVPTKSLSAAALERMHVSPRSTTDQISNKGGNFGRKVNNEQLLRQPRKSFSVRQAVEDQELICAMPGVQKEN